MKYFCDSRQQSSKQQYPLLLLGFASEESATPACYGTLSSGGWRTSPSWPHKSLGCWSKPLLLPLAVFFPFSQLLPVVYCLLALRPFLIEETQAGFGAGMFLRAGFGGSILSAFMESCNSWGEGRQQGWPSCDLCTDTAFFLLLLPALFQITWCLGTTARFLFSASLNTDPFGCSVLCSSLLFLALPNRSRGLWGETLGGCRTVTHRVAGHTLGPAAAPRALRACPPGAVFSKPPQKQNWCLGSVVSLVVKKWGFFYFLFPPPPFPRGVSALSAHGAELSFCSWWK